MDECLRIVLHHYVEPLDAIRLARVCRLWHELSTDPRAWESADLRSCGHLVDDTALDGLCRGRRQLGLRALALCSQNVRDAGIMRFLAQHGSTLQRLDLCGCVHVVRKETFLAIATSCPALRELGLAQCGRAGSALMHTGNFTPQQSGLPSLAAAHEFNEYTVDDEVLGRLAASCRNLRHLDIYGCLGVSDAGLRAVLALTRKGRDGGHLTSLHCGRDISFQPCFHAPGITNSTISALVADGAPTLRSLGLRGALLGTGTAGLIQLGQCTMLTELDLSGCAHLSDATLSTLADALPLLHRVELASCHGLSDHGVRQLVRSPCGATQLRQLGLHGCRVGTVTARAVARACGALTELNLSMTRLQPAALRELLGCATLRRLNVRCCVGLDAACVEGVRRQLMARRAGSWVLGQEGGHRLLAGAAAAQRDGGGGGGAAASTAGRCAALSTSDDALLRRAPITGGPSAVAKWPSFRGLSGDFVGSAVRRFFPFSKPVFASPHALPSRPRPGFATGRTSSVLIEVNEHGLAV